MHDFITRGDRWQWPVSLPIRASSAGAVSAVEWASVELGGGMGVGRARRWNGRRSSSARCRRWNGRRSSSARLAVNVAVGGARQFTGPTPARRSQRFIGVGNSASPGVYRMRWRRARRRCARSAGCRCRRRAPISAPPPGRAARAR